MKVKVVHSDAFGFCLPTRMAAVVNPTHGAGLVFLMVPLDVQEQLGRDL